MEDQQFKQENVYRSRKFLLTISTLILITAMAVFGMYVPSIQGVFPTYIGGILGILSLYFTGNVMTKWVVNKTTPPENEE